MSAILEQNEMDKALKDILENSRRLRDLTPSSPFILLHNKEKNKKTQEAKVKLKTEQNKRIYTLARKELTNEAIQGLFKIYYSSSIVIKIFWLFGILVSMVLCSYLVLQSVVAYLNFGVNTTVRNVVENPTDFPKITICK